MTALPFYQVDAFTDQPFHGNPAKVCLLDRPRPAEWMQAVASEMNLSETAFLLPEADGYRLRWFTPGVEVPLCGHATLASAHVLFSTGRLQPADTAHFYTLSGLLTARNLEGWLELNFPLKPVSPVEPFPGLLESLGVTNPRFVGINDTEYLVELDSDVAVRACQPDFARLKQIPGSGVCITSRSSDPKYDFVSRVFAPQELIDEDPVTGSTHCRLASYWSDLLGKTNFTAYQASARGGVLRVNIEGERVHLRGQAVTISQGELLV
jgi:predicted PhzF superfamily epimerase YddE/YHI9